MKILKQTTIMVLLLLFNTMISSAKEVITKAIVEQGKVEGVLENGLGTFKGIPYATPPLKELRWKAPYPASAWEGVLKADKFAPMAPQRTSPFSDRQQQSISEDCLYLNIITPATSTKDKLPVMVWIHGGGFITGTASNPTGERLAQEGIVYVSIAYRTGALGFLALPELSAESGRGTSGNYGLLDQILALEWIQDNIEQFGGDPSKVTIFGESAGAIAVSMLCASPLAKGLFRGAISQSGGSFCPIDSIRNNNNSIRNMMGAEKYGQEFAARMGATSLAELRSLSPDKWINDEETIGVGGFWPTVDGYVITDDQYKLYEKGEYNDVNVIIGTNSDDGSMFVKPTTIEKYEADIRAEYGSFADKVLELYPAKTDADTYFALSDIFRETAFAWPSFIWARLQGRTGKSNIYVYYFDQPQRDPFLPPTSRGAGHAADIPFVFNKMFPNANDEDKALSKTMLKYWTNFVKTGNPNGTNLTLWPEYNEKGATVMKFKNGCEIINVPNMKQLLLMNEYFKWKRGH